MAWLARTHRKRDQSGTSALTIDWYTQRRRERPGAAKDGLVT